MLCKTSFVFADTQRIVQLGAYHEYLFGSIRNEYTPAPVGILVGFEHTLGNIFREKLELRWSHWTSNLPNTPRYLMPVALFSKIAIQPNLNVGSTLFSPYINAGFGYMIPFEGNVYVTFHPPKNFGAVVIIFGGGIQWLLINSFGINVGFDAWKDLESSPLFVGAVSVGLVKRF